MRGWLSCLLCLSLVMSTAMLGCGRKDVNRRGEIKLRGERAVSLRGKRGGDLLQKGTASWYGHPYHGRKTSNGERYDMWAMTAAHKTIPFNTYVKVVNRDNGRSIVVRINDRGPFIRGRIIDLSRKAAAELGIEHIGTADVALYLADKRDMRRAARNQSKPKPKPSRVKDPFIRPDSQWTIQVGSFSEERRARAMAARMEEYDEPVSVDYFEGMYRVRVGRFKEKAEAADLAAILTRNGIDSWIAPMTR